MSETWNARLSADIRSAIDSYDGPEAESNHLGKLGLKIEPAGKVRVFAMVDAFTQWALKPLHDRIFEILRDIPMDGTFDQLRPIHLLKEAGHTRFWSFDLSSATDRLP
jgi:hypothetical protein